MTNQTTNSNLFQRTLTLVDERKKFNKQQAVNEKLREEKEQLEKELFLLKAS